MNNSGFTRIATAIVELQVANPTYNVEEIKKKRCSMCIKRLKTIGPEPSC